MMYLYIFLILLSGFVVAQGTKIFRNLKEEPSGLKGVTFAIILLAVVSVWGQLSLKQEADQKIRQTGGKGMWSDAMYSLAEVVERGNWEKVTCFDWSLDRPLFLLTKGKVHVIDSFWGIDVPEEVKRHLLLQVIQKASSRTLFLLHLQRMLIDGISLEKFVAVAQSIGRDLKLEHVVHDREGDPIYLAYTLKEL